MTRAGLLRTTPRAGCHSVHTPCLFFPAASDHAACARAQRGRTARQMAKDESIKALFADLGNVARHSRDDFRCTL